MPASSARLAASLMWAGVSKSGSPISRWTTVFPWRSSARARASTSNADSVPSRPIRSAVSITLSPRLSEHLEPLVGSERRHALPDGLAHLVLRVQEPLALQEDLDRQVLRHDRHPVEVADDDVTRLDTYVADSD